MKANTEPLYPDFSYHIYNRGINGESLFTKDKHYQVFLKKYIHHLSSYIDTYAYCLMGNHFHLLVRIKSEGEILEAAAEQYNGKKIDSISRFLSSQFAHLFNGYSQYINIDNSRTGALFESPFRRIKIENEAYFSRLIAYIHRNPEKHGFVHDFKDYPHTSYHSIFSNQPTKLARSQVQEWFINTSEYVKFHKTSEMESSELNKYKIEYD